MSVHQTDLGKSCRPGEEALEGETDVIQREVVIEDYLAHASFQRSLWMIGPIQRKILKFQKIISLSLTSLLKRSKTIFFRIFKITKSEVKQGYLCGGDVLRLFHGRMSDDCLCNPDVTDENIDPLRKMIFYEGGPGKILKPLKFCVHLF